jgi:NAD(P)-dependent dehydrogenase (short-subunit alcohol dehydrogenase family)
MNERVSNVFSDFPAGVAVVIGGSGGIGREICRRLAECRSDVALTYRKNADPARETAAAIESLGCRAHVSALDITDTKAVAAHLNDVASRFARIHTVIVATGADMRMVYVAKLGVEEFQATIKNDLFGFFNVIHAVLPHLRGGGGGAIVAMSSAAMVHFSPMDILSTGPKGGVESLVRAIAREEGRNGIRANSIGLGVIDAGLMDRLWKDLTPEYAAKMRNGNALKRIGTPQEAADAAVFLASSRASFITGQRLVLDGGYSI